MIGINQPQVLRFLTGLSLILLLLFLIFWNIDNYKRERIELTQDLKNQMSLACSEYRDSVVQRIFKIVRFDSTYEVTNHPRLLQHDKLGGEKESFVFESNYLRTSRDSIVRDGRGYDTTIKVVLDSVISGNQSTDIIAWRKNDSSSLRIEFTRDTVHKRIFIEEGENEFIHEDTKLRELRFLPNVFTRIDSIFIRRLTATHLNLPHTITKNSTELPKNGAEIIIPFEHESFGQSEIPVVVFSNVGAFLWSRMVPSLLFSVVLFSVVAMSFFTILNSWIAQNKLSIIKNEFISNMTHELKTPISTVGVAIEALENFGGLDNPEKRKEYLDISKHEINRLNLLVDKVLKMSTLEQKGASIVPTDVDIKQVIDEMLKSMKLHFEKLDVVLDYKVLGDRFIVPGDKIHLTNVFYNLIDNAIKYSEVNPRIRLSLAKDEDWIILNISDQGTGIPKEYITKIFDRFFRVPTNDKHNVKGHGLGLHYVQSIVTLHKGKISVESELGAGTTFTIKLPKKI